MFWNLVRNLNTLNNHRRSEVSLLLIMCLGFTMKYLAFYKVIILQMCRVCEQGHVRESRRDNCVRHIIIWNNNCPLSISNFTKDYQPSAPLCWYVLLGKFIQTQIHIVNRIVWTNCKNNNNMQFGSNSNVAIWADLKRNYKVNRTWLDML